MIDKITLYKEVLELEPGSRVFFPLAKLLADKAPAESINILKKGLSRHPDHIEARIFLIELLSATDGSADLDNELEIVSSILRNYPSFWKIWGAHLAQTSELQDVALAINFFGAGLSGQPLTWTDVIAQGLKALLTEAGDKTPASLPSAPHQADSFTQADSAVHAVTAQTDPVAQTDFAVQADATVTVDPVVQTDSAVQAGSPSIISPSDEDGFDSGADSLIDSGVDTKPLVVQDLSDDDFADDEEGEEIFSLRTRTMADLLAEQGDYAGAIDIYTELLSVASELEHPVLEARLQELEELRRQSAVPGTPKKEHAADVDGDGGKLVSLLESLASRFENRAR